MRVCVAWWCAMLGACAPPALVASREWPVVRAVSNGDRLGVGRVAALVPDGARVFVFGERGIAVVVGSSIVATDTSVVGWTRGATIPAADGGDAWVVGVTSEGQLYRVRTPLALESMGDRFGLEHTRILDVAGYSTRGIALAVEGGLVLADGQTVVRYDVGTPLAIAGAAGRVAVVVGDEVRTLDTAAHRWRAFGLRGVINVAMDAQDRIVATTEHGLYRETASRDLALVWQSVETLHDLHADGPRVVFLSGTELATLESDAVNRTVGVHASASAHSAVGDGTDAVVSRGSSLVRFVARAEAGSTNVAASWRSSVQSVFERSCTPCHLPDGSAEFDLTNADAWHRNRADIRRRVIVARNMPPEGHALRDDDRAALQRWLESDGGDRH